MDSSQVDAQKLTHSRYLFGFDCVPRRKHTTCLDLQKLNIIPCEDAAFSANINSDKMMPMLVGLFCFFQQKNSKEEREEPLASVSSTVK